MSLQPTNNDSISTAICTPCWRKVSDFHQFYLSVEEAHRLLTERFPIKAEAYDSLEFQSNSSGSLEDTLIELSKTSVFLTDDSLNDVKYEENDEEFIMEDALQQKESDVEPEEHLTTRHAKINRPTAAANSDLQKPEEHPDQKKNEASVPEKKRRGRKPKRKLENTDDEADNEEGDNKTLNNASKAKRKRKYEIDSEIAEYMLMTCDICDTEERNFLELRQHMKIVHNIEKGYAVCCTKKFQKRSLLWYHIQKHLNPEAYKCESCQRVFADKHTLRHHMLLKHQPEEEKIFACDHCPKKFARPYLLQHHRLLHDPRTHICDICGKGYPTTFLLSTHHKLVHLKYGIMCDICAKILRGRGAFEKHKLAHSGVMLPEVQCDECGSWHKNNDLLKVHKRLHNEDRTPHTCNICGKVSPNRKALLSHQFYMHKSERVHECGICKKTFRKPITLREHMTKHTGEVLYRCPHCPKSYNSNANLHSHRKKAHPKEFEELLREKRRGNVDIPTVLETSMVSN